VQLVRSVVWPDEGAQIVCPSPQPIYHLAPASELRAGITASAYSPARLGEDGFVHCTGTAVVALAVAADYFASLDEALYVLAIDPAKLTAPLRFEAPAPIPGGGRDHLDEAVTFPHVYGPIDREAIVEAAALIKRGDGYDWPERMSSLDEALAGMNGA
jgi:uncharacterized protein (DUF952 family)